MKQTVVSGLFFVLAAFGFTACERSQGPAVAKVGAYSITADDLRSRLQETPAAYRAYAVSPEGRRQFLDLLIREKVLLNEAKRLGIPRDPNYKAAVNKFKSEWKRRERDYEDTLQVESALRRLRTTDLAATDTEVEQYYAAHRSEYEKPTEITAAHILVSSQKDAETALSRIQAGESFDKVAKEMSKDPATAVRGGKLAPFRVGTLVPEFDDAIAHLKTGETSGVVKSPFGFHIIRKLGEKQIPAHSEAEAKDEIRARLEKSKFDKWVATRQASIGVKVDEEAVARLSLEEPAKP